MKIKVVLTVLLLNFFSIVDAQKYGTTDEGLRIQLNDDGTWIFLEKDTAALITINPKNFIKPVNGIAVKKSSVNDVVLNYNPILWKTAKNKNNEDAEFEFEHKRGSGYCMAITEKLEIPLETLKGIAYGNLQENAPDSKIEKAEYRIVNSLKVLHLVVSGTMQGIKFVYYGYYFSNENGTTQLVCYTGRKLLTDYQQDFDDILNGITVTTK
jgi:hypothetical protein